MNILFGGWCDFDVEEMYFRKVKVIVEMVMWMEVFELVFVSFMGVYGNDNIILDESVVLNLFIVFGWALVVIEWYL